MTYIQVHTGIQFARVVRVDGKSKVAFGVADDTRQTTYLDPDRAKQLAFRLLEAANHAMRAQP